VVSLCERFDTYSRGNVGRLNIATTLYRKCFIADYRLVQGTSVRSCFQVGCKSCVPHRSDAINDAHT